MLYFIVGTILSMFVGYVADNFPSSLANIDFLRVLNFNLIFIIPIVLMDSRIVKNTTLKKIFNFLLLAFMLAVGYSLISAGMGESAFYGNFFGATTVNLTMVSIISFHGLIYYYLKRKNIGLILAVLAWLISIASLAKWNFWVDVTIPILFFRVWYSSRKKGVFQKIVIASFSAILIIFFLYPNFKDYLNTFASMQNFNSFDTYLDSRVFRTVTSNSSTTSGTLFDFGGEGISDGARFEMWNDMITRTLDAPVLGIGIGARAFDYFGVEIEDHSILVFIISRFGFIIAGLILFYLFKVLKSSYSFFRNSKYPLLKYLYVGLIGNFFFQGLVGMIWGQLPVTLLLGIVLSILFTETHRTQLNAKAI
ncbi:MAG: hypothetical protein JJE55_12750 [Flavobacteriaceae bacterium]|nr:hypothetical protein [Flavobacteriaceae bacterium]